MDKITKVKNYMYVTAQDLKIAWLMLVDWWNTREWVRPCTLCPGHQEGYAK